MIVEFMQSNPTTTKTLIQTCKCHMFLIECYVIKFVCDFQLIRSFIQLCDLVCSINKTEIKLQVALNIDNSILNISMISWRKSEGSMVNIDYKISQINLTFFIRVQISISQYR